MTDKDFYKWQYRQLMERQGCWSPMMTVCIVAVILLLLCGCRTKYVPVEEVVKEYVHSTDTIELTDTVTQEKETVVRQATAADSALLARLGLQLDQSNKIILVLRKELERRSHEKSESRTDTAVRVRLVQVPYPVERKLSRWEQICVDYGKVMMGLTLGSLAAVVAVVILYVRRKVRP